MEARDPEKRHLSTSPEAHLQSSSQSQSIIILFRPPFLPFFLSFRVEL